MHWQFLYFYLEAASLFKMTFLTHSDDDFERLKQRKRKLHWIRILGYIVIVAMGLIFAILTICDRFEVETLQAIWNAEMSFVYITGAILTFYSFNLINKNSESIQKIGVRTDSRVMQLYSIFWGTGAIFELAQFFLWVAIARTDNHDNLHYQRIFVVFPIFGMIC